MAHRLLHWILHKSWQAAPGHASRANYTTTGRHKSKHRYGFEFTRMPFQAAAPGPPPPRRWLRHPLPFFLRPARVSPAARLHAARAGKSMPIINRVAAMCEEVAAWRRDFHAHPEIGFAVERTAGIVAEKLKAFGCDAVVAGVGKTGVVALIKGRRQDSGAVVGLRADMDALPILEATNLPYASKTSGKMHACGHDGHTAMLLGAARYLTETRNFTGKAVVIFQPAEEGGAGAAAMIKDGLMDRFGIEQVYGMHNCPGVPVGRFTIRTGPIMAANDAVDIKIEGLGGH